MIEMRSLNWFERYDARREGAVNRLRSPACTATFRRRPGRMRRGSGKPPCLRWFRMQRAMPDCCEAVSWWVSESAAGPRQRGFSRALYANGPTWSAVIRDCWLSLLAA